MCLLLVAGCRTGLQTPMQPGEKVIFSTQERANEFRQVSGNDLTHTGRVVTIQRPTTLTTE